MSWTRRMLFTVAALAPLSVGTAQSQRPPGNGHYLSFQGPGSNSVVDCGPWASPVSHTIEAWVRSAVGSSETIAGHIGLRCCGQGYRLLGRGCYKADLKGCGGYGPHVCDPSPSTSEWHHYAVTMNQTLGTVTLYRDGVQIAQTSDCVPQGCWDADDVFNYFAIGAFWFNACGGPGWIGFFEGDIDEVRVWDYARTSGEIADDYSRCLSGNEVGLIGYWPFDEGVGNTTLDRSGNGHHGTLLGGVQWERAPFTSSSRAMIYCIAKSGLVCGTPGLRFSGAPSASATSGFVLSADPARRDRSGIFLYTDQGRCEFPFQGGTLCLTPPVNRSIAVMSGGAVQCGGAFTIDWNSFASGQLGGSPQSYLMNPGHVVNVQVWGRDSASTGSFLSDGIEYSVGP